MSDDTKIQAVANHDQPPPGTAVDESRYVVSIDDAIARYEAVGIPRIRRTVQRYCSNGTLDAHRFAIPYGEKYLITPESLDRHIQYVLEARSATVDHGQPRSEEATALTPDSTHIASEPSDAAQETVVNHGRPRFAAASTEVMAHAAMQPEIVEMLKSENKFLKEQIGVKDAQLAVKDRQIGDQSERTRETNLLVASLHKLIMPLLGGGEKLQSKESRDRGGPIPSDSDLQRQEIM